MLKPEPFKPSYHIIAESGIWRDQVDPMLESLYFDALEGTLQIGAMPRLADGSMPTLEDYHFFRGVASALKMVRDTVNTASAIKTMTDTTEKKDEYQGQFDSRIRAARRASA